MISGIMDKWITLRMSYYQRRHSASVRWFQIASSPLCPGPLSMDSKRVAAAHRQYPQWKKARNMSKSFYGDKRFFPLECQIGEARGRSPESFWLSGLLSQERRWLVFRTWMLLRHASYQSELVSNLMERTANTVHVFNGVLYVFFCLWFVMLTNLNRDFVIRHILKHIKLRCHDVC